MPVIKIENKSDDDIIVALDGKEFDLANGEDFLLENMQKGEHSITVHRKRIPRETAEKSSEPKGFEAIKTADEKPGSHVQLDSIITFDTLSSKSVVTVLQEIKGVETLHEDAVFVGYKAELSGAKIISKQDRFASEGVKKAYLTQQIKDAVLPVGIVGTLALVLGLIFLLLIVFNGAAVKVGGRSITAPYAGLVTAGGMLVFSYFITTLVKIKKRAKELWQ